MVNLNCCFRSRREYSSSQRKREHNGTSEERPQRDLSVESKRREREDER